jgi:hypothetical protein
VVTTILVRWCEPEVLALTRQIIEGGNGNSLSQSFCKHIVYALNGGGGCGGGGGSSSGGGGHQLYTLACTVLLDLMNSAAIAPIVVESLVNNTPNHTNSISLLTTAVQHQANTGGADLVANLLLQKPAQHMHPFIRTLVEHYLLTTTHTPPQPHPTRVATLLLLEALTAADSKTMAALLHPNLKEVLGAAMDIVLPPAAAGAGGVAGAGAGAAPIDKRTALATMRLVCEVIRWVDPRDRVLDELLAAKFIGVLLPRMLQEVGDSNVVSSAPLTFLLPSSCAVR